MEEASPSKMLVNRYQTTRCHILDGGAILTITDVQNKKFGSHFCQFPWKIFDIPEHSHPYGPMEFSYGGTASTSNIEILQRFQSILNAPCCLNNHRIREDLQMNAVLSEIKKGSAK
jgi:hypothetical protein